MNENLMTFEEWWRDTCDYRFNMTPHEVAKIGWDAALAQGQAERDQLMKEYSLLHAEHKYLVESTEKLHVERAKLLEDLKKEQAERDRLRAEVERLKTEAEFADALLVSSHDIETSLEASNTDLLEALRGIADTYTVDRCSPQALERTLADVRQEARATLDRLKKEVRSNG